MSTICDNDPWADGPMVFVPHWWVDMMLDARAFRPDPHDPRPAREQWRDWWAGQRAEVAEGLEGARGDLPEPPRWLSPGTTGHTATSSRPSRSTA